MGRIGQTERDDGVKIGIWHRQVNIVVCRVDASGYGDAVIGDAFDD